MFTLMHNGIAMGDFESFLDVCEFVEDFKPDFGGANLILRQDNTDIGYINTRTDLFISYEYGGFQPI